MRRTSLISVHARLAPGAGLCAGSYPCRGLSSGSPLPTIEAGHRRGTSRGRHLHSPSTLDGDRFARAAC